MLAINASKVDRNVTQGRAFLCACLLDDHGEAALSSALATHTLSNVGARHLHWFDAKSGLHRDRAANWNRYARITFFIALLALPVLVSAMRTTFMRNKKLSAPNAAPRESARHVRRLAYAGPCQAHANTTDRNRCTLPIARVSENLPPTSDPCRSRPASSAARIDLPGSTKGPARE